MNCRSDVLRGATLATPRTSTATPRHSPTGLDRPLDNAAAEVGRWSEGPDPDLTLLHRVGARLIGPQQLIPAQIEHHVLQARRSDRDGRCARCQVIGLLAVEYASP